MSNVSPRRGPTDEHVVVDAGRLWAGGAATSFVAALIAFVGVILVRDVFDIELVAPKLLLGPSSSLAVSWAITAAVCGFGATGILHLLVVSTPRPRTFFAWIIVLLTAAAVALPFAADASAASRVASSVINLLIGIAIGTLLTGVAARTTTTYVPPAPYPDRDGAY